MNTEDRPAADQDSLHATPRWQRILFGYGCFCLLGLFFLTVLAQFVAPAADLFGLRHPQTGRECRNKFKQIAVALANYHDHHKRFPPAYTVDADGQPLHSWRTLLLPYLEHGYEYRQLDLKQRWNSAHNRNVFDLVDPSIFRCSAAKGAWEETSYLAVIGEETMWPGADGVRMRDTLEGTSNTILLVEVADSGIHWAEPRDIALREALQGINPPHVASAISSAHSSHYSGANVAFADSRIQYMPSSTSRELLRALLTRAGGETLGFDRQGDYVLIPANKSAKPHMP